MASDPALDVVYESLFVDNCCTFAGTTFLVYEYLITFGQEVKLFWRGKWTGASALFFLNRYLALISYILIMCEFVPMSDKRYLSPLCCGCSLLVKGEAAISWIQFLPWAAFSALRAFALTGRNIPLSVFVFLLGITPLAINFVQYGFGLDGYNDPTFGCSAGVDLTPSMAKTLTIASRVTLMAADLILVFVTWYTLPRRNPSGSRNTLSFSTILLRDGTIYFVVLLILNVLHLVFTLISVVGVFDPVSFVTEFTEPATAVLVSRFLLDLQSANRDAIKLDSRDPLNTVNQEDEFSRTSGTISFARFVGSLGSYMESPESLTGVSQSFEEDKLTEYTMEEMAKGDEDRDEGAGDGGALTSTGEVAPRPVASQSA